MSVRARIGRALAGLGQRLQAPTVQDVHARRSRGRAGFYMPRDQVLGPSPEAPASRQVWELYRAREESRNLSLSSPYLRAFLAWAKVHVVGNGRSSLHFPRIGPEEALRLARPLAEIRDRWAAYQFEAIGARGEPLPRLAAHALWHRLVDGDAFLVRYRAAGGGALRYQLYDGNALADEQYLDHARGPDGMQRALGITYTPRGLPSRYHFRDGGRYHAVEWTGFGAAGYGERPVPAAAVLHVRSKNEDGMQLRSWPWATSSIDWLNRVHDFYGAFVRGMVRRAGIGIYLEQQPELTGGDASHFLDPEKEPVDEEAEAKQATAIEQRLAYQVSRDQAGESVVADPGYKIANPFLPAASPQEAELIHRLELAVGAGLRCSIPTMLGDYKGANFSGSQQGTLQESETIGDLQWELGETVYGPIFADWLMVEWPTLLVELPELKPEDFPRILQVIHKLRIPPVLEKHRILPSVIKAFWSGMMTLEETRNSVGLPTADLASVVAQVRADHAALDGMRPASGGGGADAGEGRSEGDERDGDERGEDSPGRSSD